jgi:3-dehydroquinate synthase
VPTTLLAMVDSSVGGKVGINHPQGKNLIGAFHQPVGVWIDTAYLNTLPEREYRSGLAEVVKYGVAQDADFFQLLEANVAKLQSRDAELLQQIIRRSCELKAYVVERDERETTGLRMVLNFGHTFAHAYETVAGYGTWLHGEAVAAGMLAAVNLSVKLGRVESDLHRRLQALLHELKLPTMIPAAWPEDDLIAVMRRDKKAVTGQLRFILPVRLGHADLVANVPESLVRTVLQEARGNTN